MTLIPVSLIIVSAVTSVFSDFHYVQIIDLKVWSNILEFDCSKMAKIETGHANKTA
jgi:hypothetical protein